MSKIFQELGAQVIDADRIARDVVAAGTPGLVALVAEFGPGILTEDGELDRPAMAERVFGDAAARRALEGVVHPLVHQESRRLESAAPPGAVVVHDIPLLAESGRADSFDAVVVVDVPEQVQIDRMVARRGWSEEEARSRVRAQASREDRLAVATHVVDNTGSLAELRRSVTALYAELTSA